MVFASVDATLLLLQLNLRLVAVQQLKLQTVDLLLRQPILPYRPVHLDGLLLARRTLFHLLKTKSTCHFGVRARQVLKSPLDLRLVSSKHQQQLGLFHNLDELNLPSKVSSHYLDLGRGDPCIEVHHI